MVNIYSKINPNKLLHVIVRKGDIKPGRKDIIPEDNFIQCSHLNMKKGKLGCNTRQSKMYFL